MSRAGGRLLKAAEEMVAIAKGEQPAAAVWMNGHRYVPASALQRLANASLGILDHWNSLIDNQWTVDGVTWRPEWPVTGLGDDLNALHAAYHAAAPLVSADDIWAQCPASEDIAVHDSSGDVFADLQVAPPAKVKAQFPPYDGRELIREAIEELFGEKCPDFDPDCATCAAWQEWEALTLSSSQPDASEAPSRPGTE